MAVEKKWLAVPPRLMTADGTQQGLVTTTTTRGVRVKQVVVIQGTTTAPLEVQVKRVLSHTQFIVGPRPGDPQQLQGKAGLRTTSDISTYTVADGAFFYAVEQDKSVPTIDDIEKAVYEQEPVVAKRVIPVDEFGDFYNEDNPIPTQDVGSAVNKDWDDLLLDRDAITQDITKATYKKAGATVQVLDLIYDAFENLIEVKKT